jgi:hypothetical protein
MSDAKDDLIAQLKIDPQTFEVWGTRDVFTVSQQAKPEDVRNAADLLLDMVERLSVVASGSTDMRRDDAALLAQLLTSASKAAYRSLVGEP